MPTSSNDSFNSPSNLPIWFNQKYVEEALRSYLSDKTVKIVKFEVFPPSAKGENYVGVTTRIRVQYTSEKCKGTASISLILKSKLQGSTDNVAAKAFETHGAYMQELQIYEEFFPKLREILSDCGYDKDIVPRTVKIDHEHESILFLDLTADNYKMLDIKKGLDMDHTKLILEKVAKLHACSVIADSNRPGCLRGFNRGLFNTDFTAGRLFFDANFAECGRIVRQWEGYEKLGEKLLKLVPRLIELGARTVKPKSDRLNVLTHGDLWSNNAMFKYNANGEPIDVILLDFQFIAWTSPTIDLHYFFNTSLVEDLRLNRIVELIQFYHENLTKTLQSLHFNGKIPTLNELWIEYQETAFYGVFSLVVPQSIMLVDETDDASMECLMQDTEQSKRFRTKIYSNKRVQENLRRLLPVFDRRGLLDLQN